MNLSLFFRNKNLEDVLKHVKGLYWVRKEFEKYIENPDLVVPEELRGNNHYEFKTDWEKDKQCNYVDLMLQREIYQFVKNFVENKAGELTPKTMVIQHKILESMLNKCRNKEIAMYNYIGISLFMNTIHRKKIEENLASLPF